MDPINITQWIDYRNILIVGRRCSGKKTLTNEIIANMLLYLDVEKVIMFKQSDGSANVADLERMQRFLDTEDEMIRRGKKGDYAIILPDLSIKNYPTEGGALKFAQNFGGEAFVCKVGNKSEGLPCDLMGLSEDERPAGFDVLSAETDAAEEIIQYCNKSRPNEKKELENITEIIYDNHFEELNKIKFEQSNPDSRPVLLVVHDNFYYNKQSNATLCDLMLNAKHYNMHIIIIRQYLTEFSPNVRECISCTCSFKEYDMSNIKRMHTFYVGMSLSEFEQCIKELPPYHCMVYEHINSRIGWYVASQK